MQLHCFFKQISLLRIMNFRRLLSVIAMLSIASCDIQIPKTNTQRTESRSPIATSVPAKPKPEIKEAQLIAVGDIMMHITQTISGYDAKKQTYNFDSFFAPVKSILSKGDWVTGNLETPLAGEDAGGYTGYPLFNAPAQLLDAAKKAGFNILTTANNHALDRGEIGVMRTIANLGDRKIASTGTAKSQAAGDTTFNHHQKQHITSHASLQLRHQRHSHTQRQRLL